MHSVVHHLYLFFSHLGGLGLLILGVLDSSFLFMPLGNDLLLVGLTARVRDHWPYYVAMAALGSTLGCYILDLVVRHGGEEGLKKLLSPKRFDFVQKRVKERAAAALIVAALAPPPFPFTPVIAAAAVFGYARPKLLATIFGARLVRFTIVAMLALWLGRRILHLAGNSVVEGVIFGFVVLCVGGSAVSIVRWIRMSKQRA